MKATPTKYDIRNDDTLVAEIKVSPLGELTIEVNDLYEFETYDQIHQFTQELLKIADRHLKKDIQWVITPTTNLGGSPHFRNQQQAGQDSTTSKAPCTTYKEASKQSTI